MIEGLAQYGPFISLLLGLVQGLVLWAIWSLRKQFVSREDCSGHCQEHTEKRQELETRQTALEAAQRAMPTDRDVEIIKDRLGGIEGEIKALLASYRGQSELMLRLEKPLNLLMEHHLRESK